MVSLGNAHGLSLSQDGLSVFSWGLGVSLPEQVEIPEGVKVKEIAAGGDFNVLLTHDASLYAWGANDFSQLGTGREEPSPTPTLVKHLREFIEIEAAVCTKKARVSKKPVRSNPKGVQMAVDHAQWMAFEDACFSGLPVGITEVPFPDKGVLIKRCKSRDKESIKAMMLRWHPDKFQQKYASCIAEGDLAQVMERVKETFQIINSYH